MADNTNYIGVAMGMDVTDLKAGISEANKQIQLANSEFKAASSGMDDWTKSTEGITAKIKQLDSVLKMQKSKLAGLTAEYEKVAKEQGEGSEAARRLRVQINNQQAVVNKTEKEFNNYSDILKQAEAGTLDLSKATIKANGELKNMGDGAKDAGDKVKGGFGGAVAAGIAGGIAAIGAAAVAAVGSFLSLAESTRETRENFNKLETGFTTAGHSAEDATNTYKALYGVLGDEGQATEAAAHLAQLANNQEDLSKWTDIATGVYATFGASLPIENLTEAANETAKTGQITGGLADALNWAGVSEEGFQAQLDAATTEQERQALITETLNGLYSEQSATFKELNGDIMAAREADAALSQAMAELGAIAEPIMTTLKLLAVDLLTNIKPFVELIGSGLTGALNGTAGATDQLAQGLSGILSTLGEKLLGLLPTVLSTLASLVSTLLPQLLSTISGFIPILISTLAAQLPIILQSVISGINQILTTIGGMLPQLIPLAIDAVIKIAETLIDNIDLLIDAGISLLLGLADGLIVALPRLIDKIPVIIDKLMSAFSRNAPKLLEAGIQLIIKLGAGLIKAVPQLISKIPQIITSIVSGFSKYYSKMGEIGKELIEGLWNGIKDMGSWIAKKIEGFGEDVLGGIKDFFGIKSPSRVMKKEIGKPIAEGIAEGIEENADAVGKATAALGEKAVAAAKGMTANMTKASTTMSAKLLELEQDYTEKTAAVWEKNSNDLEAATAKYEESLAKRADAIKSSMGLFEKFEADEYITVDMINALETQVDALENYTLKMGLLKDRGIDAGLYEELQNMGVEAVGAVDAIFRMSASQLERYEKLWNEKNALAHSLAEAELLPEYKSEIEQIQEATSAEIAAINEGYAAELQALADEFVSIVELATEAGATLSTEQIEQYNTLGKNLMQGITEGFAEGQGELYSQIQTVIDNAVATAQSAADIHSPSKLFRKKVGVFIGEGIGVGILDSLPSVKKNLGEFTRFVQSNIGNIKSGLSLDAAGAGGRATSAGGRNTVVNAGLTVNYNGKLSRKQVKKTEDNHYKAIKMKLRTEGAI